MKIIYLAIFSLVMVGCASTSQITKYSHKNELSQDSARIYVLRPSILGVIFKIKVFANDAIVGKTGPNGYLCWDVKPGQYTLRSVAENVDYFNVYAKAGRTYFVKQKPKGGFIFTRSSLEILGEKEGRAILSKLKQPKLKYTE
jgi:hypothetical protein